MVSELELIQAAQAGDRKVAGELVQIHRGFLHSMVRKYWIPGYDYDDLLQLARIGLFEAIRDFKPDAGCKLITLGVHKIRKQFLIAFRPFLAKKRSGITISLDSPVPDSKLTLRDIVPAPIEEVTEQDYIPQLMNCISTLKKARDREILEVFVEHYAAGEIVTLKEVGEMFKLSREGVRKIRKRVTGEPVFQRLREDLRAA
jgi:RNA polymerase sporulation-specific sigma factor